MQSINHKVAARPRAAQQAAQSWDDAVYVARWLRHLAAELSCAQGLAIPLQTLLARWAGRVQPQHLFDGLRQLLEQGEVELELGAEGYRLAVAPHGRATPRGVTRGEFVVLTSAIAAVQGKGARLHMPGRPR